MAVPLKLVPASLSRNVSAASCAEVAGTGMLTCLNGPRRSAGGVFPGWSRCSLYQPCSPRVNASAGGSEDRGAVSSAEIP